MGAEVIEPSAARVQISKRVILINSASSVALRIVNVSVLVWLQQYLLKRISTEEYALYPVLGAALVFLPLLTGVVTGGLSRYIVEAYARGDERGVTQIVSTMFPLTLAAGLVILAGGGALAWYVDRVLTIAPERLGEARLMMALMVFLVSLQVSLAPFGVGFYVRQKFMLSNVLGAGQELLRIGLLFVLLFGVSTRVLWVVVASVSAGTCGVLVTRMVSCRLVPALRFRWSEIRWAIAGKLVSFGGWTVVGQLADMIRNASDPLILNELSTPVDVTCYYVGSLPYSQIRQAPMLLLTPLLPQLTAMHVTGKNEQLQNTYLRGGRYALWVTLLLAVPLVIYARELIALYLGETYEMAAIVTILLLAPCPIVYGHILVSGLAFAKNEMRAWCLRLIFLQLVNLSLTLYFVGIRHMGAVGSALGTFLTMAFLWPIVSWPLGLRLAGLSWGQWFRRTAWPGIIPAAAGAVVWLVLKAEIQPASWLALGICAAAGMAVYAIVLWLYGLQPEDRSDLKRATKTARSFVSGVLRRGRKEAESSEPE